jgi:hypothetical protein
MPQTPSNWQAESFRLTAFLRPNERPNGEGWWTGAARTQPESRNVKPARGELIESGFVEGKVLTLSVQPGRIDWFLSPNMFPEGENTPANDIRILGAFRSTSQVFLEIVRNWLSECPPIVRLAYGAVLLESVTNREAGYRRVAEFLQTVTIDPVGSEDLFYQINRPRPSRAVHDLRLNRLSKWSVSSFQPLAISIGVPQGQAGAQPIVYSHGGTQAMACRVELDLSTPAGIQELPHLELLNIFQELVNLGAEIAEQGDIA